MSKKAVVFDFDGTLAKNHSANAPEIKKNVKKLRKEEKKHNIVVLSARSDEDRGEVNDWLEKHDINADELVMRPKGNKESDPDVKKKLLKEDVSRQFKVKKAYDDEKKNVKMYKKQGIKAKKV